MLPGELSVDAKAETAAELETVLAANPNSVVTSAIDGEYFFDEVVEEEDEEVVLEGETQEEQDEEEEQQGHSLALAHYIESKVKELAQERSYGEIL
jgi:hypothetical protein